MQKLDRQLTPLIGLSVLILSITALYWGRPVLMPLALSLLLTFLLNPIVNTLHRRGLGRTASVMLVVVLLFSLIATITVAIGRQITNLASELPQYKDNIRKKVTEFREAGKGSAFERIQTTVNEIAGEFKREDAKKKAEEAAAAPPATATDIENEDKEPVPVVVEDDVTSRRILPTALGPLFELIATAGLVIVLVVFMLLRQQDLRNRLIRLVGRSRLSTTTKALDEAGGRISRYLLMQTIINATYGAAVAIGLYFIGLPYVALWGFLAFLVRFIPYVGPWLGALVPIALGLAVFEDWLHPIMVMGLFVVLELLSNMVMEPLLYGQSAGVSEVALIVAIAFWTWVWGPIGLALATPLTVCIVVLSKYIPELEFIETLMGDEPVVDTRILYYQRLLAADQDEASEVIQEYLKENPTEKVFDEVLVPALNLAKYDLARGKLAEDDHRFILQGTRDLVESLNVREEKGSEKLETCPETAATDPAKIHILGCSARDETDELCLIMVGKLMDPKCTETELLPVGMLSSEVISNVAQQNPSVICISTLPPDPLAPTKYLCKRLRERFPDIKILVGRWGFKGNSRDTRDQLIGAGADYFTTSVLDARNQLIQLIQILSQKDVIDSNPSKPRVIASTQHESSLR